MSTPYDLIGTHTRRGRSDPLCRRQTGRWSPTNGWTFDQEFSGLSYTLMNNLAIAYANDGVEYEITNENGIVTLRTNDTTGNTTIDVWEIVPNKSFKSIFESPKIRATVSANDIAVLARAYTDGSSPADAVAALNGTTPPPTTLYTEPNTATAGVTQRLYDQVVNKDNATYPVDEYSLKHTTNASNRGYYNVANVNVNKFYTPTQLYSEIQSTGYWIFPCPDAIYADLVYIFNSLATGAGGNLVVGAVKGASGRITSANNRVNITTEYQLGLVDTDRYYSAT